MKPIDRDILLLALPSIVSNVTVPLLGLADVAIMGHIGNARFIAAIAVGSMIFNVLYWLFAFLRMATSGITAQAFGAGQGAKALAVLRRSLALALSFGLAMVVLQWPLRLVAFWLMDATPDVEQLAIPYFNICVWGAPAVLGAYALNGWFVGMQNTRVPMLVAIGQNVLNILASVAFVFGLGLQIEGVALGTLVAQWCSFVAALALAWRESRKSLAAMATKKPIATEEPSGTTEVTETSNSTLQLDIFLRTLCLVAVNLYFTSAGAAQGATILAVNTLMMQLYLLFSYFLDGFAFAGEALAGKYYGAGDAASLRLVVRHLFRWGLLMALLFTALYAVGGTPFLRLLTSDAAVVSAAAPYYRWALLIPLCGVAAFVWDGIYIGLTRSRGMLLACLLAALVFFSLWLALRPAMGNHALWLALNAYLLARGLVQTLLYLVYRADFEPRPVPSMTSKD